MPFYTLFPLGRIRLPVAVSRINVLNKGRSGKTFLLAIFFSTKITVTTLSDQSGSLCIIDRFNYRPSLFDDILPVIVNGEPADV